MNNVIDKHNYVIIYEQSLCINIFVVSIMLFISCLTYIV